MNYPLMEGSGTAFVSAVNPHHEAKSVTAPILIMIRIFKIHTLIMKQSQ